MKDIYKKLDVSLSLLLLKNLNPVRFKLKKMSNNKKKQNPVQKMNLKLTTQMLYSLISTNKTPFEAKTLIYNP